MPVPRARPSMPPTPAAATRPAASAAATPIGHIIRWHEDGDDNTALTFTWDIFVLAGDRQQTEPRLQGNHRRRLQQPGRALVRRRRPPVDPDRCQHQRSSYDAGGVNENIGTNQMLCADPESKEIRRFLTGPRGCEVTGVVTTPDRKTMFVNFQHPGEGGTTANPTRSALAGPRAAPALGDHRHHPRRRRRDRRSLRAFSLLRGSLS
jgi:uncharacterized protein